MAKITGLSGMIRGKSGPNVFRVSRGVQTMSQYNPNPNNPNTEKQRDRRSIFGSSARMAKACYDDFVAGPLFKAISYKQRNALISAIINTEDTYREAPETDLIISASAIRENWTPGIKEIPSLAANATESNLAISCTIPDDGSFPTMDGVIVGLFARPLPGMTNDDLVLFSLPAYNNFECHAYDFMAPAAPGGMGTVIIPTTDFAHINPVNAFQNAEKEDGVSETMQKYRCWYVIPFSYTYPGSGLEIEIDGNLASVGKVQILWQIPQS